MKNLFTHRHRAPLAALAAVLVLALQAPVQAQTPPATPMPTATAAPQAGFVKTLRGDVQLLSAGKATRPAQAGDALAATERIVTGKESAASVVLRDGTTLVVGPSSELDLKAFSFDATTQQGGLLVSLLQGSLRMVTGLIGKTRPESVRVETQTAVIGIRGTDFIVQADPQP